MNQKEIKKQLLDRCKEMINHKKEILLFTLESIKKSLFDDTKSTSGDKHHTGRAMLQIDRENAGKQLLEIEKLEKTLSYIQPDKILNQIQLGSVVHTTLGNYFISISLGCVIVNTRNYYCISLQSPLGKQLIGKQPKDKFEFNQKTITILEVS